MKDVLFTPIRLNELESLIQNSVAKAIQNNKLPNGPTEPDKLLTIDEAAHFLNLAKQTLYGMTSKGEIPHIKRSKRLYFSKSELLEYLNKGRVKTNSEIESEVLNNLNREG